MADDFHILGDWGTSHLRLWLADESGHVCDTKTGVGIASVTPDCGTYLEGLIQDWRTQAEGTVITLSGMVGSNIGWHVAGYLDCPLAIETISDAVYVFSDKGLRLQIVPGVRCQNLLGGPDVMRGEETQVLGAISDHPSLADAPCLMCLPGTHSKWAMLDKGTMSSFLTGFSGELFNLLSTQSLLGSQVKSVVHDRSAFKKGVDLALSDNADLIHSLFQTRSRQIEEELTEDDASSFLSGLIVGSDVRGALKLFGRHSRAEIDQVVLVGEIDLSELYREALARFDIQAMIIDGSRASQTGLEAIYQSTLESGGAVAHA